MEISSIKDLRKLIGRYEKTKYFREKQKSVDEKYRPNPRTYQQQIACKKLHSLLPKLKNICYYSVTRKI